MFKKVERVIGYITYYGLMRYLPVSYGRFGALWKYCRMFSAKLMLSKCGKNVNIERGARFSPRCEVGNNLG